MYNLEIRVELIASTKVMFRKKFKENIPDLLTGLLPTHEVINKFKSGLAADKSYLGKAEDQREDILNVWCLPIFMVNFKINSP